MNLKSCLFAYIQNRSSNKIMKDRLDYLKAIVPGKIKARHSAVVDPRN
jgi:hypothetical protein